MVGGFSAGSFADRGSLTCRVVRPKPASFFPQSIPLSLPLLARRMHSHQTLTSSPFAAGSFAAASPRAVAPRRNRRRSFRSGPKMRRASTPRPLAGSATSLTPAPLASGRIAIVASSTAALAVSIELRTPAPLWAFQGRAWRARSCKTTADTPA